MNFYKLWIFIKIHNFQNFVWTLKNRKNAIKSPIYKGLKYLKNAIKNNNHFQNANKKKFCNWKIFLKN